MPKGRSNTIPDTDIKIVVEKLTGVEELRKACAFTTKKENSSMSLSRMYRCEHSPIRTQIFWIEMHNIPTFVSVHLVRHTVGISHFVESNREDRGGVKADRDTPVKHGMLLNAQSLINMARKRLCADSHPTTRKVMHTIKETIGQVDPELEKVLVPECEYRGKCVSLKGCGYFKNNSSR